MTKSPQPLTGLVLGSLALAVSIVALGSFASGAGAAGSDPYSMQAQALLSPAGTDVTLRVAGPVLPAVLEKVQVKAWPTGTDDAKTRNFFDVASPGGVATLRLTGLARGDRLDVRTHLKDGPQHILEAATTVLRRPDLTVTGIDVPRDVVRTRPFDVTATVAEVGGDVGATARVQIFDGANTTSLAATDVTVGAGATISVSLRIVLAQPREHTLRVVVSGSAPEEWDVAPNARERALYVNHYGENGVVSTDHSLATQIGADVLRNGGNAFDAAAAVQFALNVVQPHLNGIGGGSNIVVRDGRTGEVFAIDARETAPAATTPTTYAGAVGQVRPNGFAGGSRHGAGDRLPAPSVGDEDAGRRRDRAGDRRGSAARGSAGTRGEDDTRRSQRLHDRRRPAAVARLQRLRRLRAAPRWVERRRRPAGVARADARVPRDPRNEGYPWGFATRNSLHVFIEAMRLAFADRDFWLGDDRYTNVSTAGLLDPGYLSAPSALIRPETAMCNPSITVSIPPGNPLPYAQAGEAGEEIDTPAPAPGHTTHFSIIDRWGNAVVITSTIRTSFGTGITVPGYGFLLNDSPGLFNQIPKAAAGNPGANDAAGGKRPLGNMTPTLILKDGELFAGTGTLGSMFIPSVVLNVVLNLSSTACRSSRRSTRPGSGFSWRRAPRSSISGSTT
jgi:Gamma-glutamyltranspeptidase